MDLEQRLIEARARRHAASEAWHATPLDELWEECVAANAAVLDAERALAASRGEEHAVPLELPVRWRTDVPFPHLLVSEHRAFLIFFVMAVEPGREGTYATIHHPESEQGEPGEALALVELEGCRSAKLGEPNDEVLRGHPLAGKGLRAYSAQLVRNSRWLAELQQINSVHSAYRPEAWQRSNHYVFWFHDTTFECIAESFTVELHDCWFPTLLAEACRRLVEDRAGEPRAASESRPRTEDV